MTNILSDWEIDDNYISNAISLAKNVDIVSFDIFDTTITRIVESPVDVFAEVERRLVAKYGSIAKGFSSARIESEIIARKYHFDKYNSEEITLNNIYDFLQTLLPKFCYYKEAEIEELLTEQDVSVAIPDNLKLTKIFDENNIPYVFVSDMYLSSDFLFKLLTNNGYIISQKIYVSSEINFTKSTGNIWKAIGLNKTSKVLHIGDNEISDILNPTKYGIKTLRYERTKSEPRRTFISKPENLIFSYINRQQSLEMRSNLNPITDTNKWKYLGSSFGAIIVGYFIKWLEIRAKLHNINKIYFCSRDGYLLKKAWDATGLNKSTGIEGKYLYISRSALNIPEGIYNSCDKKIDSSLLYLLCTSSGNITIKSALQRVNLLDCRDIYFDAIKTFGSLNIKLNTFQKIKRFEALLKRHTSAIYYTLVKNCESIKHYLSQEGLISSRNNAIVDLGWHGTIQRSMNAIIKTEYENINLKGFYYGLWPHASSFRYNTGFMEGCFANEFLSHTEQPELSNFVDILEELHSAPHGTVIGYNNDNGCWTPVFKNNNKETIQYHTYTKNFQEGVIEAVTELFKSGSYKSLKLKEITKDTALAAIGAISLSPIADEIEMFSNLSHCSTFDHDIIMPIISKTIPRSYKNMNAAFLSSGWKIGTLKYWHQTANKKQKYMIKIIAQNHLTHLKNQLLSQLSE